MKIETKFDIGDNIYLMEGGKITRLKVRAIIALTDKDDESDKIEKRVHYCFDEIDHSVDEECVFGTEDELIKSIENETDNTGI